jgi:hypothetical protein
MIIPRLALMFIIDVLMSIMSREPIIHLPNDLWAYIVLIFQIGSSLDTLFLTGLVIIFMFLSIFETLLGGVCHVIRRSEVNMIVLVRDGFFEAI